MVSIPSELDAPLQNASDPLSCSSPGDRVERLASLKAPTANIDQMLTDIESGYL